MAGFGFWQLKLTAQPVNCEKWFVKLSARLVIVLLNNWCEILQYPVNSCMIITYNIVYCVCDEEFDSFCCWLTTMSRVMEHGGCRIASPAWQTKSHVARHQYSQATVNNLLPLMTSSPAFLTRPPSIAHSAWMHGILWNAIFTSLIA